MALDIPTLTAADIQDSNWEACLAEAHEKTCCSYVPILGARRTTAASTGDQKRAAVFQFFASLASLRLRSENPNEPFAGLASGPGWRLLTLEDFGDEQLALVEQIYLSVGDPEMRARLADVRWVTKRDHKAAQVAVAAYLDAANTVQAAQMWLPSYERIERATYIGLSIKGESRSKAINFIEE